MLSVLRTACLQAGGSYADVRYEERKMLAVEWDARTGVTAALHYPSGGYFRVLANGIVGTCGFSAPDDLFKAQHLAQSGAKAARLERPDIREFGHVSSISDLSGLGERCDVSTMEEQAENIAHLGTAILQSQSVTGAALKYQEFAVLKHFCNSQGTAVAHTQRFFLLTGWLKAESTGREMLWPLSLGGNGALGGQVEWGAWLEERMQILLRLLHAGSPDTGIFPVILHPTVADLLVHEALGHFCEADLFMDDPAARRYMQPGRLRFGSELLTVVDDATLEGGPGSYRYDDEGVPGQRTLLVSQGLFRGRLHSLETAREMGESATGNGRAAGALDAPLPRMSNVLLLPGHWSLEEMVGSIRHGFLVVDGLTAQTVATRFSIEAAYGHVIRQGKITAEMVRGIYLKGSLKTLKHISQIGDQLLINRKATCGKSGQFILNSGRGSPYVKVDEVWIGGTA